MKQIQEYARAVLADLSQEPLLSTLADNLSPARSLQILPYVAFWSNAFQDIIALNLERVRDPAVRAIVQQHYNEDVGHNHWLVEDLRLIYRELPDLVTLFAPEYLNAREISYAFMAEVYRAESDWERLALVVVLEEGAKVVVTALIEHFRREGLGAHLKALGQLHVDTEAAHDMHGEEVGAAIAAMQVASDARARALAMIDRAHATFVRFVRMLDSVITRSSVERERAIRARLHELAIHC